MSEQAGLDTKRLPLLDQQSPGLEAGYTIGQEAAYIASEWTMYSDMKGRAAFLLTDLPKEIHRLLDRIEELEREVAVWRNGGVYVSKADWHVEDLTGGILSAEGRRKFAEMTEKPPQPGAAQRRIDKLEDELRERRRK